MLKKHIVYVFWREHYGQVEVTHSTHAIPDGVPEDDIFDALALDGIGYPKSIPAELHLRLNAIRSSTSHRFLSQGWSLSNWHVVKLPLRERDEVLTS